jgi:hypothetical protein
MMHSLAHLDRAALWRSAGSSAAALLREGARRRRHALVSAPLLSMLRMCPAAAAPGYASADRTAAAEAYRGMLNYTPRQVGARQRLMTPARAAKLAAARERRRARLKARHDQKALEKQQRKQLVRTATSPPTLSHAAACMPCRPCECGCAGACMQRMPYRPRECKRVHAGQARNGGAGCSQGSPGTAAAAHSRGFCGLCGAAARAA